MRVIGIVAEFNPFHQGHENLIARAREIVNDPRAIVMPVISESFVQRGLPAIIPADVRTRQALRCGADVVLGLPFTYSCAPSARFALGGIATLLSTGVITDIAFGYDAGTPELLKDLADQINEDSAGFKENLKNALAEGLSYPAARASAIKASVSCEGEDIDTVLKSPNSILALEYLAALKKIDKLHRVNVIMIPRDQSLESATSVRKKISGCAPSYSQAELFKSLEGTMPDKSLASMLASYSSGGFAFPDMAAYIRRALMHISGAQRDIGSYAYMGDDLDGYLKNLVSDLRPGDLPKDDYSLEAFAKKAETKRFTMTRIYRAIASFEAGQDKELVKLNHPPYIRVLGFNREGRYCLKIIGKCTKLPVISNPSDALELCSSDENLKNVFELEMRASAIANELYGRDIAYSWSAKPVML
ncbi:MAG: nucleotidyltransferase family protein [Ruminococcaceae bacterium]|nr:nucleotidyltransferase family protein [Oscillospiraceae bacterium]